MATILTASSESELNTDILTVDGSKTGDFVIEITSSFTLDQDIDTVNIVNTGVSLQIVGPAVINADGFSGFSVDYTDRSVLTGHTTIDGGVDTVGALGAPTVDGAPMTSLAVGGTFEISGVGFNFDDAISVVSVAGSSEYQIWLTPASSNAAMELYDGAASSPGAVPVALGLEDGADDTLQAVDLSAAPLSFSQFQGLTKSERSSGAYMLASDAHTFVANISKINADNTIVGVDLTSGSATLAGGASLAQNYVAIAGATLNVDGTLKDSKDMSVLQGALDIARNAIASFTGVLNVHAAIEGKGELITSGGCKTVVGNPSDENLVSVADWTETGAGTSTTFVGQNHYLGAFTLGAGAEVTIEPASSGAQGSLELSDILDGPKSSAGTVNVSGNDVLAIDGAVGVGQTINVKGGGTLTLLKAQQFQGQIENFSTLDQIVLQGDWNAVSVSTVGQDTVLLLNDVADKAQAKLAFEGSFTLGDFKVADHILGVSATTGITFA